VLSLLVVPVVFTYVDDIEHFIRRTASRLRRKGTAVSAPPAA
jgi:hypothetical protein